MDQLIVWIRLFYTVYGSTEEKIVESHSDIDLL